jgi:hypothetical protein
MQTEYSGTTGNLYFKYVYNLISLFFFQYMTGKKEEAKEQKKNLQSLVIITPNKQTNPLKILYLKMFITYSSKFCHQTRM